MSPTERLDTSFLIFFSILFFEILENMNIHNEIFWRGNQYLNAKFISLTCSPYRQQKPMCHNILFFLQSVSWGPVKLSTCGFVVGTGKA